MTERKKNAISVPESSALPGAGQVRVAPIAAIPALLREHGEDPESVFAECGLDLELLADPENTTSFSAGGHLLDVCARRTGVEHFGLLVGQRAGLESLGLLGELGQYAPDAGAALRAIIQHLPVHDRGSIPTLTMDNGMATLSFAIYEPRVEGVDQIHDIGMAVICNIMRSLCGETWVPSQVLFAHSRPADVTAYRRFFRAALRFDMEQTALVFPEYWLHQPLQSADTQEFQLLEAQLASLHSDDGDEIVDALRRTLRAQLVTDRASLDRIAQLLALHRRTLNRRLKDVGTTFRDVMEETRFEYAKQLLRDTQLPVLEIANALHYSDSSAFTRAFRRWSGTTPAAWRKQ